MRERLSSAEEDWRAYVAQQRFSAPEKWESVLRRGIDAKTLHGFHYQNPLAQFTLWAAKHFQDSHAASLIGQPDETAFDAVQRELIQALLSEWSGPIKYGQAAKLVSLSVIAVQGPATRDTISRTESWCSPIGTELCTVDKIASRTDCRNLNSTRQSNLHAKAPLRTGLQEMAHFAFSDQGGTTPFIRAYATNCPMCSLA
jgi:hypothetical protein